MINKITTSIKKIIISSDHRGYKMKEKIKSHFRDSYEITDLGCYTDKVKYDYYEYAKLLSQYISINYGDEYCEKRDYMGILICNSGIGMSISSNRNKNIRAALCRSVIDARLSREHNDANVLVLGALPSYYEGFKNFVDNVETIKSDTERIKITTETTKGDTETIEGDTETIKGATETMKSVIEIINEFIKTEFNSLEYRRRVLKL